MRSIEMPRKQIHCLYLNDRPYCAVSTERANRRLLDDVLAGMSRCTVRAERATLTMAEFHAFARLAGIDDGNWQVIWDNCLDEDEG